MTTKIYYLLYFSITFLWEHSTQQIIPVQNYPIYQQEYKSVPITIPVSVQPIYNEPCSETCKVQIPINSQANLAPVISENINKFLINKILSNIGLPSIVDPNVRLFKNYGMEIPKQVPNYSTTPNIVNNYFIVPPGCFKLKNKSKDTSVEAGNKSKIQITKKKNCKQSPKKRNSKLQRNAFKRDKIIINNDYSSNMKKEYNYCNDDLLSNMQNAEQVTSCKNNIPNRNNDMLTDCFNSELDIFKEINPEENRNPIKGKNTKSKKRSNKKKLDADDEDSLQKNKNEKEISQDSNKLKPVQTKITAEPINKNIKIKANKYDNKNTESVRTVGNLRKTVKISQQEKLMQEYKRQYPNTPDYILKNMMLYMNNQYRNPLGFNYPNNLFPFNFNQIYQLPQMGTSNTKAEKNKKRRRKQKNKKKSKRRRINKKSKSVVNKVGNANAKLTNKDMPTSKERMETSINFFPTDSAETYTDITAECIENHEEIDSEVVAECLENHEAIYNVDINYCDEIRSPEKPKVDNREKYFHDVLSYNIVEVNNTPEFNDKEEKSTLHNFEINTSNKQYKDHAGISSIGNFELSYDNLPVNHYLEDIYTSAVIDDIQTDTERIVPNLEDKNEELHLPELGYEDVVPTLYENGLIEDYYPIFTDNAHFANNQEYYIKDINDRHYYITDKNPNPERRLERFANFRPLTVIRDKLFNNVEQKANRRNENIEPFKPQVLDDSEIIEFRRPPALEFPGFVTKEVKKAENSAKYIEQKSSTYSDFKTPLYDTFIKPYIENRRVTSQKIQPSLEVETVYVPSKVVKYGQFETEDTTEPSQINLGQNEDLSYVIAKSTDYAESFW